MRLTARTLEQIQSPIASVRNLLRLYKGHSPVLDLSQGMPCYATAPVIAHRIAEVACAPDGAMYTERPGLESLRRLVAEEISQAYAGAARPDHILITAGCNQAFCVAISALAENGDEVIISVPYYFNHDMWLRLEGMCPVYLCSAPSFVPDPAIAETLISNRTRAIVLVSPGNPTGVTIPPSVIQAFADLARANNIVLMIDETYRVFRASDEPPHELFSSPNWEDYFVSLHSFSKEFAIPGHRVGAAVGHPDLILEMMKLFDCIAICAPRLGQVAAIEGLASAKDWRRARALDIRKKQAQFESVFSCRPGGFEVCSAGAFFGWVRYPDIGLSSDQMVIKLLLEYGILVLPGTVFSPTDDRYLRFSFGNATEEELDELGVRLGNMP